MSEVNGRRKLPVLESLEEYSHEILQPYIVSRRHYI